MGEPDSTRPLVPVAGILGNDDDGRVQVGRVYPANTGTIKVEQAMYQGAGANAETSYEQLVEKARKANPHARRDRTDEWDFEQAEKRREEQKQVNELEAERQMKEQRKEELGNVGASGGLRFNRGKIRMDLTPPEWEWALADVTTQGSRKYEERNWEKGMNWSAMVGCAKRHIDKFLAGERYDGEEFSIENGTTGCHHLAMAAWNLLALMSYDLRGVGTNDLPDEVKMELLARVNAATSNLGNDIHGDD